MILDTPALIAILCLEGDAAEFATIIERAAQSGAHATFPRICGGAAAAYSDFAS
jgi:hypothetical protein